MSPTTTPLPPAEEASRRTEALARYTATVSDLLDARADLHGVHPMADLVYDAARWSA